MGIRALLLLVFAFSSAAWAGQTPPGWPWQGVSMGFPDAQPADVRRYKELLRLNVIRLQLKSRQHAYKTGGNSSKVRQESFEWADRMLDECAKNGVRAVINISHFPIDPSKPNQRSEEFWADDRAVEDALSEMGMVVSHFRGRGGELVAYDFMSEPVLQKDGRGVRPPKWPEMLTKVVDLVRKGDDKRWLVVSPGPWGGAEGYEDFTIPSATKIILGVHMYSPHQFTHQDGNAVTYPGRVNMRFWDKMKLRASFDALREVSNKSGFPVLVGEFSAVRWAPGGEQYLIDLTSIFNESGWGWLYFSAAGWHGWDPDYNQNYPGKDGDMRWQQNFMGSESERWNTLRMMFGQTSLKVQSDNK
jgi:aryl-phospho-beta-D-glucosidase BglC (GH1 family)